MNNPHRDYITGVFTSTIEIVTDPGHQPQRRVENLLFAQIFLKIGPRGRGLGCPKFICVDPLLYWNKYEWKGIVGVGIVKNQVKFDGDDVGTMVQLKTTDFAKIH